MLTVHQRPFQPDDRSEAGRREGDLIIGKDQRAAIGTLVERTTRVVRLLHLRQRDGDSLHEALKSRLGVLPPGLVRSITWDQGTEMARHVTIAKSLGAPIYFCDSRSPWQRGSNENMNGLLRDHFPKGTDLRPRFRASSTRQSIDRVGHPAGSDRLAGTGAIAIFFGFGFGFGRPQHRLTSCRWPASVTRTVSGPDGRRHPRSTRRPLR